MRLLSLVPVFFFAACGDAPKADGDVGHPPSLGWGKARIVEEGADAGVGRFQYYPPGGDMPAVLLDTQTGCVEIFEKITSLDNPKDVRWWRSYADTGKPHVTYENGKAAEVPDSAPPRRCLSLKASDK